MNGSPEPIILQSAQNQAVIPPIGTDPGQIALESLKWAIAAPLRVTIYGLFDLSGHCFYVGQTFDVYCRKHKHTKERGLIFRQLRTCEVRDASRIEIQVIKAYKRRGECEQNKHVRGSTTHLMAYKAFVCPELHLYFYNAQHAGQFFGWSDSTICAAVKHHGGDIWHMESDQHFTLIQVSY